MASWLNLETPGQILAVWYPDDDVYHERILVWRHSPGFWMTLTPDGDRYIEDLRCAGGDGPSRVKIKGEDFRYWSRVGARAYRFAQPPSDEEFKGHIQDARREMNGDPDFEDGWFPDKVLDMSGNLVAGSSFVPGGPARRRLTGKTPATSGRLGGSLDPAPRVTAFPTLGSSELWVVADPRGDLSVGLKLEPLRTDVFLGDKDGVFLRDGFWVRGEVVAESDLERWRVDRLTFLTGMPSTTRTAERLGILEEPKGNTEDDKGEILNPKAAEIDEEGDARTLWIEFDDQGDRYREWRKVVSDSVAHSWKDWPHQGPASLHHTLKHFHRHGGCPRTWFQSWLRRHGMTETDRTAHEVRSLIEALWLGGCYDQLNMPSLASFEAIGRRLQTIVEAYANSAGGAPDWGHAKLFTGAVSADDLVSGDLRAWAAKKGKEEVELIAARSKIKDMKKLLASSDSTAAAVEDALPNKGRAKNGRLRKPEAPETS